MKFYATIKSNRATKGQGGDYLLIHISGEDREPLWQISVGGDGDISINDNSGGVFNRAYTLIPTKAKKQKGEIPCVHYYGIACMKCNK